MAHNSSCYHNSFPYQETIIILKSKLIENHKTLCLFKDPDVIQGFQKGSRRDKSNYRSWRAFSQAPPSFLHTRII